ncbi:MAG TPA: PilZ domain-containing protein [Vicinamibacterales bacterium]
MTEERRQSLRYRIDATIAVDDGTGRAIDLSANGVFFESPREFMPGDQVALTFPIENTGPGASVTCSARVVRIVSRGELFGVAATYEPVSFTVPPPAGS